MATDYPIRTGRHCAFLLHAHLVFVTKYRAKVFTDEHLHYLQDVMRKVCQQFECELVEFNGADNQVHLLVNFPPKVALSRLVNSLKGVSSRYLRRDFPEIRRYYWRDTRLWAGSYFAGSLADAPLPALHQYIKQQNQPA